MGWGIRGSKGNQSEPCIAQGLYALPLFLPLCHMSLSYWRGLREGHCLGQHILVLLQVIRGRTWPVAVIFAGPAKWPLPFLCTCPAGHTQNQTEPGCTSQMGGWLGNNVPFNLVVAWVVSCDFLFLSVLIYKLHSCLLHSFLCYIPFILSIG